MSQNVHGVSRFVRGPLPRIPPRRKTVVFLQKRRSFRGRRKADGRLRRAELSPRFPGFLQGRPFFPGHTTDPIKNTFSRRRSASGSRSSSKRCFLFQKHVRTDETARSSVFRPSFRSMSAGLFRKAFVMRAAERPGCDFRGAKTFSPGRRVARRRVLSSFRSETSSVRKAYLYGIRTHPVFSGRVFLLLPYSMSGSGLGSRRAPNPCRHRCCGLRERLQRHDRHR